MSSSDPGQLAVDYLLALRQADRDGASAIEHELGSLPESDLADTLDADAARLAFWIDLYNAAVLLRPAIVEGTAWHRARSFRRPVITVAGRRLSLDAIEHGILRRSRWKLGLGFLVNPLPARFERRHRVDRVDPRIHFALNCAAASCPPIAAYRADTIDQQLHLATRSYLASEVRVERDGMTVPRLFLWFMGDFGGPSGVRSFLRAHAIDGPGRRIRFAPFDWSPRPGRWRTDEGAGEADRLRRRSG